MTARVAMGVTVVALAAANVLANRVVPGAAPVVAVGLLGALAAIARSAGLSLADLGLARATWGRGLRWGLAGAGVVAAGYAVAVAVARVRGLEFSEADRAAATLTRGLVLVPLLTVVPEELAFRGVLWSLGRRAWGTTAATLASSALFGVWHVFPALSGGAANSAASGVLGENVLGVTLRVLGTVAFTGAAGVLLCELRRRSDSLVAPVLFHWATNALGLAFVVVA